MASASVPFGLNRNSGIGWRRALNQLLLKYDSTIVRQQRGKAGRGRIGAVDARPYRVTPGASAISRPSLVKLSASVSMGAVTAICGVAIVGGRGAAQLARKSANKAARKTAIMGVLNTHSASRLAARCKPYSLSKRVCARRGGNPGERRYAQLRLCILTLELKLSSCRWIDISS